MVALVCSQVRAAEADAHISRGGSLDMAESRKGSKAQLQAVRTALPQVLSPEGTPQVT